MLPDSHRTNAACRNQSEGSQGITCCCGNISCHVTRIEYPGSRLEGTIPANLSNFKYLNYVDLSSNKIGGAIPDTLANLSSLEHFDLRYNQLNGSIPKSLGKLKSLKYLDLSANLLNGSIPSSFVSLGKLELLDVSGNNLSGPIPPFLGNLTTLTGLVLGDNRFTGTLPPQLGNLKNLGILGLWSNKLCGSIPHQYAQLESLEYFLTGGNNISGHIPTFFGNWTNLGFLDLMGNNFEGPIPREIFELSSVNYLYITDLRNSASQFPLSANLTSIQHLFLRNCSIYGVIPPYVGKWQNLQTLDLSFNNLAGGIPDSIQNLSSLSELLLAGNKLNGMFPTWVSGKDGLSVDLSYNKLQISENVKSQNVSKMNVFDCCSTNSAAIKEINMASLNRSMESRCPHEKSKRSSWRIDCGGGGDSVLNYYADNDTSNSRVYLEQMWAYSCSGDTSEKSGDNVKAAKCGVIDINAPLYDSARYCPVSLVYYGFCLRDGNYTVQLFFSELVNTDMEDYSILSDRTFDIYVQGILRSKDFNIIEKTGSPKQGWTEIITKVAVADSSLKIQLYWAGKGSHEGNGPLISAISATIDPVYHRKLSALHITLIALSSAVFALLLLLLLIWKLCWSGKGELNERYIELLGRQVTVKQIVGATRNFSPKMEIGKGGFGTVYRAELLNQIVAVKKLSGRSIQGMDEFKNEVYTLKSLKHENLVQLLDGYAGKDLLLLIYEYMENNSLSRALFESTLELNWETRFNICLGVAKGLKYLHEDSRIKIVHRDIKASNILLDGNVKPKISDFGLARLYDKNENQNMTTIVGGTRGYMAPEYAMRGILTEKADIYSFGVLLLEIVSGKNNADYKPNQESVFLLDTAYVLHKQGRLMDLVDKKLERYNVEQVRAVLHLGMMCTSQSPSLRPTMSQVVSVLEDDKTIEQVAADRAPTPPPGVDYDRTVDSCFTEISCTWTDGASASSTAYYVIREKDGNNRPHEISNETGL